MAQNALAELAALKEKFESDAANLRDRAVSEMEGKLEALRGKAAELDREINSVLGQLWDITHDLRYSPRKAAGGAVRGRKAAGAAGGGAHSGRRVAARIKSEALGRILRSNPDIDWHALKAVMGDETYEGLQTFKPLDLTTKAVSRLLPENYRIEGSGRKARLVRTR